MSAELDNKSSSGIRIELSEEHKQQQWEDFKKSFGRQYEQTEEVFRRSIFVKNLQEIHSHNELYKAGKVTFEMGVNQFSDQTEEEMRPYFSGFKKNPVNP